MITWFTGNMDAGKTTFARRMIKPGEVLLDGNALRKIWTDLGLSKEDRIENNWRIMRLAAMLESQGFDVIVASICPYRDVRDEFRKEHKVKFIKVAGGQKPSEEFPYED